MFLSKIAPCEASSCKVSGLGVLNDFWKSLKHFEEVLHAYVKQTDFRPKEIPKYRQELSAPFHLQKSNSPSCKLKCFHFMLYLNCWLWNM